MNAKKAKKIRKALKLKLPVVPDYRVSNKVTKLTYNLTTDAEGKEIVTTTPVERISIVNAAKNQYRAIKKVISRTNQF